MKFRYGDKARITTGFWKGFEGEVTNCRTIPSAFHGIEQYYIKAIKSVPGKNMFVEDWFPENILERVV